MPLKYHVFEIINGKLSICSFEANPPFSIIFSKVFETLLQFRLNFFHVGLKLKNDIMI